jgi:competence protein ComEC
VSLTATVAGIVAWAVTRRPKHPMLPTLYLWASVAALAAAYHHAHLDIYPADDIGEFADAEPRLARLRGRLNEEPVTHYRSHDDPLVSQPRSDRPTHVTLAVSALETADGWQPASGIAWLSVPGPLEGLHAGDEVEAAGWLAAPAPPQNPGEWDYRKFLRDQRVRAVLNVRKTADSVTRLSEGWRESFGGWLARLRGWGQQALERTLPPDRAGLATALLLGDGAPLDAAGWEKYVRTGVVHALAISGQHLVVLAGFLWLWLRVVGVRRRRGAAGVALLLFGYALLTGGRPPVLRAAVMVLAAAGGTILLRPVSPLNAFALAWLVVLAVSPADPFTSGCQLSFLAVAVLAYGTRWLEPRELTPQEELIAETRPLAERAVRAFMRWVALAYAVNGLVGLATMPLIAGWQNLVSPAGLVIGPPVVGLTSVALIAGFGLLLSEALGGLLSQPFAWVVSASLGGCEKLVDWANATSWGWWYVGTVPAWWLWGFYLGLLAALIVQPPRPVARWLLVAASAWVCVGLIASTIRPSGDEMRMTFLAVGHGGCTVIETPDGRTLVYDAGALTGPEVTRRHVAPFLWHRGVRRIDEVFLSHADLDHFNGLPDLLAIFPVGQVTTTPSFSDKSTPGVKLAVAAIEARGIPVRSVWSGQLLGAGAVEIDVLHPPEVGPAGTENVRSMVLRVRHAGHTILLTGDLEGEGLGLVMSQPSKPVDVLMAPHHGSKAANTPTLAAWAKPRLVVACQGPPHSAGKPADPYRVVGARVLGTWPDGAVTLHSHRSGLVAETFVTGTRFVVTSGGK